MHASGVDYFIGCPGEIKRGGDLSPFETSGTCITSENLDQPSMGLEVDKQRPVSSKRYFIPP